MTLRASVIPGSGLDGLELVNALSTLVALNLGIICILFEDRTLQTVVGIVGLHKSSVVTGHFRDRLVMPKTTLWRE